MELMNCPLAVPNDVMQHVVRIESSFNPYAIGVVGGRLARQPRSLPEAVATVRMLEGRGFNFSVGLAQVNRHNLARLGLGSYERAFEACPNLQAGARILAECHGRSGGNWGKAFSCYYSGNFTTGYRHGYVQKVFASIRNGANPGTGVLPIPVTGVRSPATTTTTASASASSNPDRRIAQRATPVDRVGTATSVAAMPDAALPVPAAVQSAPSEPATPTVSGNSRPPEAGDGAFVF